MEQTPYILCHFTYKRSLKSYQIVFFQIDNDDIKRVKQYNWSIQYDNIHKMPQYLMSFKLGMALHRYVMNCKIGDEQIIDHKDQNSKNNQKNNLRSVTTSQNSSNVPKRLNAKSKYYGIVSVENGTKWQVRYKKQNYGRYFSEKEAAKVFDSICFKNDPSDPKINFPNDIDLNVVPKLKNRQYQPDMKYIRSNKNSKLNPYYVIMPGDIYLGAHQTIQKCKEIRDKYIQQNNKQKEIKQQQQVFYFLKKPCIQIKHQNIMQNCFVSIEDYYDLIKKKLEIDQNGYPRIRLSNGQNIKIHKYIISKMNQNINKNRVTDHIDGNKLNAQRSNLRVITQSQNSQNRKKKQNTSSQYIGVSKNGNKWSSKIVCKQSKYYLGIYDNEQDAAKVYNQRALQLFGEQAKLNKIISK